MSINCKINEYMNAYTQLWTFSGAVVVADKGKC